MSYDPYIFSWKLCKLLNKKTENSPKLWPNFITVFLPKILVPVCWSHQPIHHIHGRQCWGQQFHVKQWALHYAGLTSPVLASGIWQLLCSPSCPTHPGIKRMNSWQTPQHWVCHENLSFCSNHSQVALVRLFPQLKPNLSCWCGDQRYMGFTQQLACQAFVPDVFQAYPLLHPRSFLGPPLLHPVSPANPYMLVY